MNEAGGPQDPGGGDDKPPDAIVLGPEDMPEGLARQIEEAIAERQTLVLMDHAFLIERARAAGHDAKALKKLYPTFPKWVREDIINRKLTIDSSGFLRELH